MGYPTPGSVPPAFTLPDQDGRMHALADYQGRYVLVYFYPKDDTPGCTKEACTIRDAMPQFTSTDIVVLGISPDSVASHRKFADKYGLPFTLLADEHKEAIVAYGAWGKKKFMGREYDGVLRSSVLVAPDGTVAKVYENVKPQVHAAEVLADVIRLKNA